MDLVTFILLTVATTNVVMIGYYVLTTLCMFVSSVWHSVLDATIGH